MNKKDIIIHRVNSIEYLKLIDHKFGCEIDIRTNGSSLILNHDPFTTGVALIDFLDEYRHGTLVLNIKETGIEKTVLEEIRKRNISSYFLLDVEMPFTIKATMRNEKNIAVRFSEFEPIENASFFINKLDWIWIDSITKVPINKENFKIINQYNVCVVCPSLWNRVSEINDVERNLDKYNFHNIKVITKMNYVKKWINKIN